MFKIMIIEDNEDIRDELVILLNNSMYSTVIVEDFKETVKIVERENPDLILLDIVLPGTDGMKICKEIRKDFSTPIIFVTSNITTESELNAILIGGDDYITKPYNTPILLARINSILKRFGNIDEKNIFECKNCQLSLLNSTITYKDKVVELTRNELRICYNLFSRCGQIVPRGVIIDDLWDNEMFIDDNTLSVNITRIRGKLKELGLENLIETKRGIGYKI